MSPTRLKAFLNVIKPGLNSAMIYPVSDQKFLRLAIDLFILYFAYDDPFDDDALRLDEGAATKFTNTIVSAITDTESFEPVSNMPVVTAYHEYVFYFSRSILLSGGKSEKEDIFLTRSRFRLFHSFFVRLQAESTASAYKRLADEMVVWILSVKRQVEMRARDKYPNIKEYILNRRVTVAMKVSCLFPRDPLIQDCDANSKTSPASP